MCVCVCVCIYIYIYIYIYIIYTRIYILHGTVYDPGFHAFINRSTIAECIKPRLTDSII